MPCDKLERTVVSVSRAMCADTSAPLTSNHLAGRVYRQMSTYVNPAGRVVSSTKMAIHTAGRVHSIVLWVNIRLGFTGSYKMRKRESEHV